MLDDLNARNEPSENLNWVSPRADAEVGKSDPSTGRRPMADREVPITVSGASEIEMMHAWLDGDLSESQLTGEAAQAAMFWNRLDRDLEVRRQMRAPLGLADRVMAALPTAAPALEVAPWWTKPVTMNPVAVAAASVGLLALGAAIGAGLRVR